jgi:AcrR family transcriptional regulator
MGKPSVRTKPRSRIVETARDLFRKHGIKGIGVDAIAEAAGTNKMTLYRHFGSKDELIAECMRDQARRAQELWTKLESDYPGDPLAQLHGWVRIAAECLLNDGHGCALANAAVQLPDEGHPARRVIEDFKKSQHESLAALCRAAGASDPGRLADALSLLIEGARMSHQTVGPNGPSAHFVQVAETVIGSLTSKRLNVRKRSCERVRTDRSPPFRDASKHDLR